MTAVSEGGAVVIVASEVSAGDAIAALAEEHVVRTATTVEAVRPLLEASLDLLIVDLDDIGSEAFALIRELAEPPMILMLSSASLRLAELSLLERAGVIVHVARKPVTAQRLKVLVRTFVELARLRREEAAAAEPQHSAKQRVVVLEPYGEMCLAFLGGHPHGQDTEIVWAPTGEAFLQELAASDCALAVIDADGFADFEALAAGVHAMSGREPVPVVVVASRDLDLSPLKLMGFVRKPASLARILTMKFPGSD